MKENKKSYWSPGVTIDAVIFTIDKNDLKILLIKRNNKPFLGYWALPGGFLLKNESAEHAASRILKNKAGVKNVYLEQLYAFDSPGRDPRGHVITIGYFALLPKPSIKITRANNLQDPTFHPVNKLPLLAFDHKNIIKYALTRLHSKIEYTNVVYSLLSKTFTLDQLQKVHEIIWNKKLDKRNFRKKFISLGLIKPAGKKIAANKKTATIYKFVKRRPVALKKFF